MMFTEEHKVKYLQTLNAIIEENLRKCLYFGVFLRFSCLASGKVGLYHVAIHPSFAGISSIFQKAEKNIL